MNDIAREYLGPTNGNGNGNGKTPSERAWDTARQHAREQGQTVRTEEIRCIKSKGLSSWAKVLFWILSKICWEASPFLHQKRVGSVCITSRQLQLHFGFPNKRLYAQTKRIKSKDGETVTTRRAIGSIEELVNAGFVWMSRKPIVNIPAEKWPNVFNVLALVPQETQPSLGLMEDVVIADDPERQYTNGGSSLFFARSGGGSGQTPQNGLGRHQRGEWPTPAGGSWPTPTGGVGQHQRGEQWRLQRGEQPDSDGGSSQTPTGGAGNSRLRDTFKDVRR